MSSKEYYQRWLELKAEFRIAMEEDVRLQELAINEVGIKPQGTAVELVSRVYSKYCDLFNKLCECYDQMAQVQRRPFIKKIIDAITCRIIELKETLEKVEVFEFTYPDNAFQQLLIQPKNIEILCPFFYSFEMRKAEMQYIMDQIFAGIRLGDPPLTEEQLALIEAERLEEEEREKLAKQKAEKEKTQRGNETEKAEYLTPEQLQEKMLLDILNGHANNIKRMERARTATLANSVKAIKDQNLYLELSGQKKPQRPEYLRLAAAKLIQKICKQFMALKRAHARETKLKEKLGMVISSYQPPSATIQLEKAKDARRKFRHAYYEKWVNENLKEKSRVLKLRGGDIMEDITDEIRQWFTEWFEGVRVFDEFPWPNEGGSILIVKGETFTIEEYLDWRTREEKRLKALGANPQSKAQIKNEKKLAREEQKKLALEDKMKKAKRLKERKKARLNPDSDPGIYIEIGQHHEALKFNWQNYETEWASIDTADAPLGAIKGHLMQVITENIYKEIKLDLRQIADEAMKLELNILKSALKADYATIKMPMPMTRKRKKPKTKKPPAPDKVSPQTMFQKLADVGIVRKYPRVLLDEYLGDRNYAAANRRAVLWTPEFPPHCVGDIIEQIRIRCILTIGSSCKGAKRSQLLVGPKGAGKKTLAYAVATETNSLLIDLSPFNVCGKFSGAKNQKRMFKYVNRISRLMQPTVIFVDNADKLFYKRVPPEEKMFDPTGLSNSFYKQIIKPLGREDKILVIGTATEPWLSKSGPMFKVFPSTIMIPRTDYGSISYLLTQVLMKYHGINRDFNVHSTAQALRGYSMGIIKAAIDNLLTGKRLAELHHKPLQPMEILLSVQNTENARCYDKSDMDMYQNWYWSYTPWGAKFMEYMLMIESQYNLKLKADQKKPKVKKVSSSVNQ